MTDTTPPVATDSTERMARFRALLLSVGTGAVLAYLFDPTAADRDGRSLRIRSARSAAVSAAGSAGLTDASNRRPTACR